MSIFRKAQIEQQPETEIKRYIRKRKAVEEAISNAMYDFVHMGQVGAEDTEYYQTLDRCFDITAKFFPLEKAVHELHRKMSTTQGDAMKAYEKAYFIADKINRGP
jgi:hypothetical protein